jgi:hypothetical protein
MDNYQIDKTKDALFRGEFEVVKELIAAFEDGAASKRECDKASACLTVSGETLGSWENVGFLGHRQERTSSQGHRHQAAEREHCRIQAELRNHGRCCSGLYRKVAKMTKKFHFIKTTSIISGPIKQFALGSVIQDIRKFHNYQPCNLALSLD